MISHILTDIEGTTTSISFVHDILFPYSFERIEDFLCKNKDSLEISKIIARIKEEQSVLNSSSQMSTLEDVILFLKDLITKDVKYGPLKEIQGLIWKEGYQRGAYQGHIYPDVKPSIEDWQRNGIRVSIYSSGSTEAQKLLFKYSSQGDMSKFIFKNFDTIIGQKRDKQSYINISKELQTQPSGILFLSDVYEELEAAESAGLTTCQLLREKVEKVYKINAANFPAVTQLFSL